LKLRVIWDSKFVRVDAFELSLPPLEYLYLNLTLLSSLPHGWRKSVVTIVLRVLHRSKRQLVLPTGGYTVI
jgi:hypothetical protein